ncbi:MAG TPA: DUF4258 domain-containing protein [Longimicrobiaceae bacterium]
MSLIDELREKIFSGEWELSQHAVDQAIRRGIDLDALPSVFANAEVIEDYPNDKYGPSCLILGFMGPGRPLHVQCTYPSRPLVKIITLYEPDPELWVDHRMRRGEK